MEEIPLFRITSDCPLVDPAVIDNTIDIFNKKKQTMLLTQFLLIPEDGQMEVM